MLVNEDNIVDAEIFEQEASDANREDADKERHEGKRKMDSGEEKRNQDNKRRSLQLLASEKKLFDKFSDGCLHGPSRHDLNRIVSALEFGPTTKEGCTIDASGIINAVQGADERPHDEDAEFERWRMMHEGMEFWDDVNDWKPLKRELAVQARKLEMEFFKKMGVYKKVPRDVAKNRVARSSPQKWVDTNKGDTSRPNYRSRLFGREVKCHKRLDLLFGDSPLETLMFLCSTCSVRDVIDIKRAYSYAPARRPIFIEISKEDLEPEDERCVDQLQLSLYGTRDAAQNWAHENTTFMLSFGFQVAPASPCNFAHRARRVHLTVHGDDFTVVASAKQIAWIGEAMRKRDELKMEVLGPNARQTEEVRVLNRIVRWTRTGLEYEPDQRHAERTICELELETCMSVSTPRVQERRVSNKSDDG